MQRQNSTHYTRHRRGNLRVLRVSDVILATNQEAMNLRMKRILNLSCITGKGDLPVVNGDFVDRKPMLRQPAGNPGQILQARPKTGTILCRSEPLVVRG